MLPGGGIMWGSVFNYNRNRQGYNTNHDQENAPIATRVAQFNFNAQIDDIHAYLQEIHTHNNYFFNYTLKLVMSHAVAQQANDELDIFLKKISKDYPKNILWALNGMVLGYSKKENKRELYAFLEKVIKEYPECGIRVLKAIAFQEHTFKRSLDKEVFLKALSEIGDPVARQQLAKDILPYVPKSYNVRELLLTARNYYYVRKKWQLSYNQVQHWFDANVRELLLQNKFESLPEELYLHITSSVLTITADELADLRHKLRLKTLENGFFKNPETRLLQRLKEEENLQENPEAQTSLHPP